MKIIGGPVPKKVFPAGLPRLRALLHRVSGRNSRRIELVGYTCDAVLVFIQFTNAAA
jgi:hypothetical protein